MLVCVYHTELDRKRDTEPEPERGTERETRIEKHISCVLHIKEWKLLLLLAAFGMSESYFVQLP